MGMPLLEDELKTGRVKWAPRFRQPGAAKLLPELSTWFHRLEPQFGEGWRKVGIYGVLKASLGEIKRQKDVLLALIELWSWETNTFVFPWGEMTVTLEDLAIMGLPLFGKLACDRTWDASDRRAVAENELEIRRKTKFPSSAKVTYAAWIREWMGGEAEPPTMRENQAFLALWLCRSVLPSSSGDSPPLPIPPPSFPSLPSCPPVSQGVGRKGPGRRPARGGRKESGGRAGPGPGRDSGYRAGLGPGCAARRAGSGRSLSGWAGPARPDTHPYSLDNKGAHRISFDHWEHEHSLFVAGPQPQQS
ncbi:hypothetical protein EJ110_NYTH48689 [Nymphaea thermarum]|nr:hypothetical protein EJ110_NYTH48689 [Nymphaea thermarum]